MNKRKIVILGAGYGGIMTTVKLQKMIRPDQASITLINKYDYHFQSNWLYESAAGTTHHEQTKIPIKDLIHKDKVQFIQDTVIALDPIKKQVKLTNMTIDYDILVLGLGIQTVTNEDIGLEKNAFTIDNINHARLVREHIEYNLALYNNEVKKNQARLNFVVAGDSFTSIQFIGALANRIPELCKEYDIDKAKVRMVYLDSGSTILPEFDAQLIEYAISSLEAKGVEFITEANIIECQQDKIIYEKDDIQNEIPTMTMIWTARNRINQVVKKSEIQTESGKVKVGPDLRTFDFENVFAVGECAFVTDLKTELPYRLSVQLAVQEANTVANNVEAIVSGNKLQKFEPNIRTTVASLGEDDAIGIAFGKRKLFGWKALALKKMIENYYLFKLGGLKLMLKKGKFNVLM